MSRHAQQLAEHLSPRYHWNFQRSRAHHLGIRELDRRRNDYCVELIHQMAGDMARMMSVSYPDTEISESPASSTFMQIAPADREAEPLAQLRNPAHARAANADKMQAPLPRQ
jgi:hypothetical protein